MPIPARVSQLWCLSIARTPRTCTQCDNELLLRVGAGFALVDASPTRPVFPVTHAQLALAQLVDGSDVVLRELETEHILQATRQTNT